MEAVQSIKDAPLKDCPECGKPGLERLISASSFQLKGSGWYKDAYSKREGARTEKQVQDSLSTAIDKDKKKASDSGGSSSSS
jgi:putative FmdB family regulatory protein